MANGTFDLTFDSIAHEDDFGGGVRFATDWKGEDGRMWRVSSVDHSTATETMIFPMEDGEPIYFDIDGIKKYMGSKREHGAFLAEALQRELNREHDRFMETTECRPRSDFKGVPRTSRHSPKTVHEPTNPATRRGF